MTYNVLSETLSLYTNTPTTFHDASGTVHTDDTVADTLNAQHLTIISEGMMFQIMHIFPVPHYTP